LNYPTLDSSGLGWADKWNYTDQEGARRLEDQNKTTLKDMVCMILELSLRRSKGQLADTVMKSTSLHLKTPDNHPEALTDMNERY